MIGRIENILYSFGESSNENTYRPKTIVKRDFPLLGIIGKLERSPFGTLTLDDAALFNENIDRLFEDQKNIINLENQRTHYLNHKLDEITHAYHETKQTNSEFNATLRKLEEIQYSDSKHITTLTIYQKIMNN